MRLDFRELLAAANLDCKSSATRWQWNDLKQTWVDKSAAVRRALDNIAAGEDSELRQTRALEVIANDAVKRV